MSLLMLNLLSLLARYIHIVCATLLVGGTLFYEMVVPVAIEDLRSEHQLEVMGRARWVFRWIVWLSLSLILLSGVVQVWVLWDIYSRAEYPVPMVVGEMNQSPVQWEHLPPAQRPGWWWVAHASAGVVALLIALSLTMGRRPPERPVEWMRWNLMVLLIVIFLGTATFHVRLVFQRALFKALDVSPKVQPMGPGLIEGTPGR